MDIGAPSQRAGKRKAVEAPVRVRKTKKVRQRRSVGNDEAAVALQIVIINDPTIEATSSRVTAHDVMHFFTKGKAGTKTHCNICL